MPLRLVASALLVALGFTVSCRQARWTPPPDFPARGAPRYEALVSAAWVKSVLEFHRSNFRTPRPATYRHEHFVILEASWATLEAAADYRGGHVPGAVHFNTDELENGYPRWQLQPIESLQQVIARHGITPRTMVVVYGKQLIAAARVWWTLLYAGVADVRLLDGGLEAWNAAGYPLETAVNAPPPATFAAPVRANVLATTEYVRDHLNSARVCLVDVRSEAEFAGRESGYDYLEARGRIPEAIHAGNADDKSALYRNGDGSLRDPAHIRELWRQQGLVSSPENGPSSRELIFYCGGGWRSSVAFFHAWLLGYQNIRNYSDGWCGWSTKYRVDATATGSTPGWRQETTGNPVVAVPAQD